MINWELIRNFSSSEFDSPDERHSGRKMKNSFIQKLQKAREIAGIPFRVTSGFRTIAHNKKVGGKKSSSHLTGWAADVSCKDNLKRIKIVSAAVEAGIKRIGISSNFIHLDDDPNKIDSLWLYGNVGALATIFGYNNNTNQEDL